MPWHSQSISLAFVIFVLSLCLATLLQVPPEENGGDGLPKAPRQTGSMSAHHDTDIVTRMKNIETIELGRHRIKPWYFSPYPQVGHDAAMFMCVTLIGKIP